MTLPDQLKHCDNCKRPFEPFDLDKGENGQGIGFIVREGDIEVLMSNLEYAFCCFTEYPKVREDKCEYWCVKCVERVTEDDNVES